MGALIATRYLVGAARLRKNSYIDVLDVSARHGERDEILRLAGGRAGMAANAASVIDYLSPINRRDL
jgi:hypothetical protein